MKKLFLSIFGAIALMITCTACSDSKTTWVKVNGKMYSVDTFVVNHLTPEGVERAIIRAEALKDVIRPSDASSFGAKKAEVIWYAFEEDMKADLFVRKAGTVTVVHYESGIEIIKDGKSWFYDGFEYDICNLRYITACIENLERSRWEPAGVITTDIGVRYEYLCTKDNILSELWLIPNYEREKLGIKSVKDIIVQEKEY